MGKNVLPIKALFAGAFLLGPQLLQAQCANAFPLTIGLQADCSANSLPVPTPTTQSNVTPLGSCGNGPTQQRDVWFTFTASSDATVINLYNADQAQLGFVVYRGPCASSMTLLACAGYDILATGTVTMSTLVTVPGTTYYIRVSRWLSNSLPSGLRICAWNVVRPPDYPFCGDNGSFELGNTNGWRCRYGHYGVPAPFSMQFPNPNQCLNPNGPNAPLTGAANPWNGGNRHTIMSNPSWYDPNTNGSVSGVAPGGGQYSFRLGNNGVGCGTSAGNPCPSQASSVSFDINVTTQNAGFTYMFAAVLENPSHQPDEQPRFEALVYDASGTTLNCGYFLFVAGSGLAQFRSGPGNWQYTEWTEVGLDLTAYMGQTVTVEFRVSNCYPGSSGTSCSCSNNNCTVTGVSSGGVTYNCSNVTSCSPANPAGNPNCTPAGSSNNNAGAHAAYAYVDAYCKPLEVEAPEFCAGTSSIQICAPPGYRNYRWQNDAQNRLQAPLNQRCVTVNNPQPGTRYRVDMELITGCPTHTFVELLGIPVTLTNDTSICPGESVSLFVAVDNPTAPPYTHQWSHGLPPTPGPHTVTPAQTTTYTVTTTNGNGCSSSRDITVTVTPCAHTVTATGGATCPGGCATVSAQHIPGPSGNFPPYTYSWSNGLPGNPGPHSVCPAQTTTYTVTVTDANGASATATATVVVHPQPTATTTSVNARCFAGSDGSVTANPTGGTTPYSYSWNTTPPQTTGTATGLPRGNYTVTITDANGCSATATATVGEPPELLPTTTTTPANCGVADGSATVTPAGGTGPYTYSWNTTPPQTTQVATNLTGGSYDVTVTDANGCSRTVTALVQQTGTATLTTDHTDVSCNGGSDGTVTVDATGGNPPFTYSWNTVPPQTTPTATGVRAGTWTVSVTDAIGCVAIVSVTVGEPTAVVLNTSATPDPCQAGEGTTLVTASGGTPPYTYLWNTTPPQASPNATGLPAGTYTVTVTDNNGCTATASATVTTPQPLAPTALATDVSCFGGTNGTATGNATGGTQPYSWSWNSVPPQATQTASNLPPGTWTVTVTDVNGCTASVSATVNEPTELLLTSTPDPANCGAQDGRATVDPTGGTPPYTYLWNTTPPQTSQMATGLPAGVYSVVVTDANGCTRSINVTVTTPTPGTLSVSHTNVSCNGGSDGDATVTVTGGNPPFNYSWNTVPPQTSATASNIPAGTWTVTVTDAEGCVLNIQATVDQPTAIVPNASSTPTNCGMANGSATGGATGGTPPYSYAWNTVPPQTSATASNIPAGPWTVTITDANGCVATANTVVNDIPGPTADFNFTDICLGNPATFNNGSVAHAPPGSFTSNWDLGDGSTSNQTNPSNTYANPGTYTVTLVVTDLAGCTSSRSRDITVHPIPQVDFSADPREGCAPVHTVFVNNIPPPGGTCLWDFGDGTSSTDCNGATHPYTRGGCYNVRLTVTSAAGCANSLRRDTLVCVTPLPVADFTISPDRVPDTWPIVNFLNGSRGATRYYWEFLNGDSTSTRRDPTLNLTGMDPGVYNACLWVWNDYGCVDSTCRVFRITTDLLVYVPNAFSPDGDGHNEIFIPIITGHSFQDYLFQIFNRWGELIFETNNPVTGWNGYYNGVMSESEVYVWKLKVKPEEGADAREFIGHVTLLK